LRQRSVKWKIQAFVNDSPVNLDQLRRLCILLVDLHQQFDILALGEAGFQLDVVDALASNAGLLALYQQIFQQVQDARNSWNN
jgi:DNA repair protein RecN (Recombination protein N)